MNKEILNFIVCPNCKGDLLHIEKTNQLLCKREGLAYAIEDNIPILLVDEAKSLSLTEVEDLTKSI